MKLLIILLLSFSSFGQDTCGCNLTRQQIRINGNLRELEIKKFDDQHKRENTKEIKSFRFQLKTFKAANNTLVKQIKSTERMYNDRLDFVSDSLKLVSETKLQIASDSTDLVALGIKKAHKAAIKLERKKINWNVFIWLGGIFACLIVVLVIVVKLKR